MARVKEHCEKGKGEPMTESSLIKKLEAENATLEENNTHLAMLMQDIRNASDTQQQQSLIDLRAENAKLREALVRIQNWAQAYPLDVFPKPDLKKAHKVLKAAGMTLDAISADAMRHVLDGVKGIVEEALKED